MKKLILPLMVLSISTISALHMSEAELQRDAAASRARAEEKARQEEAARKEAVQRQRQTFEEAQREHERTVKW